MNMYTREIAALLNISLEEAVKVQDEMECNGIDYSECTKAEFKREAKFAYANLYLL